jgi:uncharacterized damage-inducible protein DinB
MPNELLSSLFQYKAWANRGMFEVLRRVPDGQHTGVMVVAILTLDHVAIVDRIFRARLAGEPEPFEAVVSSTMPKLDELWDSVRTTDEWYVSFVRSASQSELDEIIHFTFVADRLPGRMSRAEILGHVLTHGNSHRGAVGKMLEGISVAGPADMFTTFLHRSQR